MFLYFLQFLSLVAFFYDLNTGSDPNLNMAADARDLQGSELGGPGCLLL